MTDLSSPALVMARLEGIENDLAERQNGLETSAREWDVQKRERERTWATTFVPATGTVDARKAAAIEASAEIGMEAEAAYEAQRAVCRVLEARATIGQSLLRAMGRS